MPSTSMSDIELVQRLHVQETFNSKSLDDSQAVEWNKTAQEILKEIGKRQPPTTQTLAFVAELDGQEVWLASETRQLAQEFLASTQASVEIVKSVLESNVKPLFLSNPHPQLNLSTGRALPRVAGGPMAAQDYYDEQAWKKHPGVTNVLSWCIRQIPSEGYEQVWHLLIPPVMTFLDDYQAAYKLRGVVLVSELLQKVPANLLKRTGVGQLLMISLPRVLMNLHDAISPRLIRSTVPVILKLIDLTTSPGSTERFDQLCLVLGENIVGGVWLYASRDLESIEASMDVIPAIVQALGIGTVRYLKALIPQCVHCITPDELVPKSVSLEVASLKALLAVIRECQPRIHRYKGAIIEGVSKYWVARYDRRGPQDDQKVQELVRDLFNSVSKTCPAVLADEYSQLLRTEPDALRSVIVC